MSEDSTGTSSFTPKRKATEAEVRDRVRSLLAAAMSDDYYGRKAKAERGYNKTNPGKAAMTAINSLLRDMLANSEGLANATGIDVLPGDVKFDASGGTVTLRFNVRDANSTPLTWQGPGGGNMLAEVPASVEADAETATQSLAQKPKKKKKRPMTGEAEPVKKVKRKKRGLRLPPRK